MTITQLTNNGTSSRPGIRGSNIVWSNNNNEIVLFDGTATTVLPNLGVTSNISPQISDDGVTWLGYVNGWQVFFNNGNTTTQLTNLYAVYDVEISGNKVVWRGATQWDTAGSFDEIYLYDSSTGTTSQLTNNGTRDSNPDISGNNVVWKGAGNTIHLYDGTSTTQLTSNGVDPYVSGNEVAWEAFSNGKIVTDLSI